MRYYLPSYHHPAVYTRWPWSSIAFLATSLLPSSYPGRPHFPQQLVLASQHTCRGIRSSSLSTSGFADWKRHSDLEVWTTKMYLSYLADEVPQFRAMQSTCTARCIMDMPSRLRAVLNFLSLVQDGISQARTRDRAHHNAAKPSGLTI